MRTGWIAYALPAVVGVVLRALGVQRQILTDDEMHTVSGAIVTPLGDIVRNWTLGEADYSVPLAAGFRLAMDAGAVLSEMHFRVPSLVAGALVLMVLPPWLEKRLGRRAAVVLAWLLALSPMLILYSRIVRSYMPVVLVAGVAALALEAWLRTRSRPMAALAVVAAPLAIALHLGAGPFVLAPFLYGAARIALGSDDRRRDALALAGIAAAVAVATVLLLLPARESIVALIGSKRDGQIPVLGTWLELVRLHAGTSSALLAALVAACGARGAWLLWQRERPFLLFAATLVATQVAGLLILSPDRLEEPMVLCRYLLVALPWTLALVAVGIAEPFSDAAIARRLQNRLAVIGIAIWFATGPLASSRYVESSFTHAPPFLRFTGAGNSFEPESVPRFYRDLASRGASGDVLEHPSLNLAYHAFDAYQRVHGRRVRLSSLFQGHHDARVSFRNLVEPKPAAFLASAARHLVVHLDLRREASRVRTSDIHQRKWLGAVELWQPLRRAGGSMARRLAEQWGAPVYSDEDVHVWDLDAVRANGRAALGRAPRSAAIRLASGGADTPLQPAPGSAALRPAAGDRVSVHQDPDTGRIAIRDAPLRTHLGAAWGVHPLDVVFEVDLDTEARYDSAAHPKDGEIESARRLLREVLREHFGLVVESVLRSERVGVLRRSARLWTLEPSREEGAPFVKPRRGRLEVRGAPMSALANYVRRHTNVPIVNETGLRRRYDFVLEWDPGAGAPAFHDALDDLGLDLRFEEREVPKLVVRRRS